MCKECCKLDPRRCKLTPHSKAKVAKPSLVSAVEKAMMAKSFIWICYWGGKKAGEMRCVRPENWIDAVKEKDKFEAYDPKEDLVKTYFVHRISEVKASPF
jgi:hypothetical protein